MTREIDREKRVDPDSAPDATIILVRAEERGRGFLSYLPSAAAKHSISHGISSVSYLLSAIFLESIPPLSLLCEA